MAQLNDDEILEKVKNALGIIGEYQDPTIRIHIDDVKEYMKDAGVRENVVNDSVSTGAISRGVADLWNYGAGTASFSNYFLQRVTQLAYKKISTPTTTSAILGEAKLGELILA